MMLIINLLATLGLISSLYVLKIEFKIRHKKSYKPICDIKKNISCSKTILSKYNDILGIPNSLYGIVYYLSILLLSIYNPDIIFYLSIVGGVFSLIFGYISFFKLKTFCLICNFIYLINILLLISSLYM